jgi:hypothetical protein
LTTASKHQKYSCFHQLETIVGFDQIIPSWAFAHTKKILHKGPPASTNCQKRTLLNKIVKKDHLTVAACPAKRHVARAAGTRGGRPCRTCQRHDIFFSILHFFQHKNIIYIVNERKIK